jgi:DNA-binding NarL/FixJ family response regulator
VGNFSDEPRRVVVVDDSEDFRMIFRLLLAADARLEIAGEAADGSEGLDLCDEVQPDVVVLDLAMPRVDGATALPQIKARCPGAEIYVYSAVADGYGADELLASGAAAVLNKGDSFEHVFDVLAGTS